MAIAWRSTAHSVFDAVNPTGSLPAGHASGDLLLAHMQLTAGGVTLTPPSGWTEVTLFQGEEPASNYKLFWKIDGGSEVDPVWTGATPSGGVTISAYSGVDATTPIDSVWAENQTGSGSLDYPTVTSRSDNALVVASYSRITGSSNVTAFASAPSPLTTRSNPTGQIVGGTTGYVAVISDAPVTPHWTLVNPGLHGAVTSGNRTAFMVVLHAAGEADYGTQSRVAQITTEVLGVGQPQTSVTQVVVEALSAYAAEVNEDVGVDYVGNGALNSVQSTSKTLEMPAGIAAGDFLLAIIQGFRTGGISVSSAPSGWAAVGDGVYLAAWSSSYNLMAYWKIAEQYEPSATFTFSGTENGTGRVYAWRGVDPTTPIDAPPVVSHYNGAGGFTQSTPVVPAIAESDEVHALLVASRVEGAGYTNPFTYPDLWVEIPHAEGASGTSGYYQQVGERGFSGVSGSYVPLPGASIGHSNSTNVIMLTIPLRPGVYVPPASSDLRPYVIMVGD